jgi:hypothetical protein
MGKRSAIPITPDKGHDQMMLPPVEFNLIVNTTTTKLSQ